MDFTKNIKKIVGDGLEIEVFTVPWDSEIFGFPVAQIERIEIKRAGAHHSAMQELQSWFDAERIRLTSCRLPSTSLDASMLLEAYGFRFVEMVYRPTYGLIPQIGENDHQLRIERAGEDDLREIEAIAASAFTTGRFFLDTRLDPIASHRRYAAWVRNSFADPGQQVLMVRMDRTAVAFFIVELRPDAAAYWHLTAVAPGFQGKGLGRRVWTAMLERHRAEGVQRVETTVSAHNVPVLNLYARLGFKLSSPQTTFHWVQQ